MCEKESGGRMMIQQYTVNVVQVLFRVDRSLLLITKFCAVHIFTTESNEKLIS